MKRSKQRKVFGICFNFRKKIERLYRHVIRAKAQDQPQLRMTVILYDVDMTTQLDFSEDC